MIVNIACTIIFVLWVFMFFACKKPYHLVTYVFWGVFFPLYLYQLNWSGLIDSSENSTFDLIFVVLAVLVMIYSLSSYRKKTIAPIVGSICVTRFGKQLALPINFIYIFLYLIENYLGSGSFIPGLVGIDIHTYSAPIISYFTNAQFLVLAFDYFYFKATKKKNYIVFMLGIILVPVLTRFARMTIVMSLLQIGSLILFCELNRIKAGLKSIRHSKKIRILLIVIAIGGFIAMSRFTQYRMDVHNAGYTYASGIMYTGPEWLSWIAPFYGYFPLSFNNLKINIINRTISHDYVGLYSFAALYFGILQLDNVLGISTNAFLENRLITHGLATVPTAFWEYYYDFGMFFFIPIIVALLITRRFEKRASNEQNKLTYHTLYFWYVSYWFFTSFQNTLFLSTMIVVGIITHFVIKRSFYLVKE